MKMTFEEQCRLYKQQQTVSGKRTQKALDQMADQMQKVTGKTVLSGTIHTMKNERTGDVIFTGSYFDKEKQKMIAIER